MTLSTFLLLGTGLALLVVGAELLVRGASRLATALGISPLIVGLTVVAFGTSSPELAVSIQAAWSGQSDLAVGNVVGSNIFNVLFILGLSAVVAPLVVSEQLVRLDVPLMIAASLLLYGLAADGALGRGDGWLLFTGIVVYLVFLARRRRSPQAPVTAARKPTHWSVDLALVAGGMTLLVLGSRWLVAAAISIATALGVSELVIGLTIVAAGTSLPEVATSVLASIRGERDIAVGNVVGSNLFNILAVLGLSSLVSPDGVPVPRSALLFDIVVMIGVAVACLPIFFSRFLLARWEGALFLAYYAAYTVYLVLHASDHPMLPDFRFAMLYFVLPLTALTLAVLWLDARKQGAH